MMLAAALAYIARGWRVFPVHGIRAGICTCRFGRDCRHPGKHPRTSTGFLGATLDPGLCRSWWTTWPEANIGIATGEGSGIVVIDIDDPFAIDAERLPDTPEVITGRGGRHIYLLHPADGQRYVSGTHVTAHGVDSRADGGYVVAPPSLHASGQQYQWDVGMVDYPLAEAPAWWLDAIRRAPASEVAAVAPAWVPDGELPAEIEAMLTAIPSDDYATWRDVGLALNHCDPAGGLAWWDWWSARSAKFDERENAKQWASMTRRAHHCTSLITLDSVRRLACEHGWVDPEVERGGRIYQGWLDRWASDRPPEPEPTPLDESTSTDLMPPSGLVREIALWICRTSIRPQPELAVAAAAAFVGTLAGRKFETATGLRSGLYLVGLAESGAGKDHARKQLARLALAAGAIDYLGGERLVSGAGLVTALARWPSQLFMPDEFGIQLQSMTSGKEPHKKDLLQTLMTLYSSANSVVRGTEYGDQKLNKRVDLVEPNVSLYAVSTPQQFYKALTSMQGVDGSLARMVVISAAEARTPIQEPEQGVRPDLVEAVRTLARFSPCEGNLASVAASQTPSGCRTLPYTPEAKTAWLAYQDTCYEEGRARPESETIWTRVAENASRLALVQAVAQQHDSIDADSWAWGARVAWGAAVALADSVARYVSDNEIEAGHKRITEIVRKAGRDGISKTDLSRGCRGFRRRDLEDALAFCVDADLIRIEVDKSGGRPRITYRIGR